MYGQRLRTLRKRKNLTIEEMSEMIELPKSTLGNYERESKKPSLERLVLLANFYNTTIDYILGLTEDPEPVRDDKDASKYLQQSELHWNGVPLSDEDLEPVRDILERIIWNRLPKDDGNNNNKR